MSTTIPSGFGSGGAGLTRGSKAPTLETLLNALNTEIVANYTAIAALQTGAATGIKAPVRCATLVNGTLATAFAAGQTVDGVTLVLADRILIKAQSTGAENGIYTANATGAPTRAADFDGDAEVMSGVIVSIAEGTVNKDSIWQLTTNNPVVVDTTAMVFEPMAPELAGGMYDPVRVATVANGTLATAFANAQTVDGITLATDDRILLKDQSAGSENGIYTVNATGAPTRAMDFNSSAKVLAGAGIPVAEGTVNEDTVWQLTTDETITLGSTALVFAQTAPDLNQGMKAPVDVATVASGTLATAFANAQTVDGVTLATGDRILLKDQSSGDENGIYIVQATGAPVRAADYDSSAKVLPGHFVGVSEGTVNADTAWQLITDAAITLDTTPLVYAQSNPEQGMKRAVVCATIVDGTFATAFANTQTVDGVTLATGDRILLKAQSAGDENGIYIVQATGAPVRAADMNSSAKADPGHLTPVSEGTVNADTVWQLTTVAAITLDTTALVYAQVGPDLNQGVKAPCRAASDGALTLVSDFENGDTVDGVVLATGDRILVKDQASGDENGIYIVTAGAPVRAADYNIGARVLSGNLVPVSEGTNNADTVWQLTTNGVIVVDTTALVYAQHVGPEENNGMKTPCRAASVSNGTLATAYDNGKVIDGVTLATGDRLLLRAQTSGAENGIWIVTASGIPTRAGDYNTAARVLSGGNIPISEGDVNADTIWMLTNNGAIVVGTTALVYAHVATAGAGVVAEYLGAPDAKDDNHFLISVVMQATAYTLDETTLPADNPPRNVIITHTTDTTTDTLGDAVVVGTDVNDDSITETLTVNADGTVIGTKAFKTLVSVTTAGWVQAGGVSDLLEVGYDTLVGLSLPLAAAAQVFLAMFDGVAILPSAIAVDPDLVEENTIDISAGTFDSAKLARALIVA